MNTMTDDPERTEDSLENWFLLMDPTWRPAEGAAPPPEAVVGLWPVDEDGGLGRFRPNRDYRPAGGNSPTDPLDAVLRLVLQARAETSHLQLVLRDAALDLAVNADGRPLITRSPDDVPCVVVVTGEPHRDRLTPPGWHRVDLDELVVHLADGVDVLINPGGPASTRLTGDFIRETLLVDDERITDPGTREQAARTLRVIPWNGVDPVRTDPPAPE